ncbi:transcriptional coactivator/pterin dehydratase, partial [Metschnikowia bicuspidata var. bicuspidata NRRL YB-4993]
LAVLSKQALQTELATINDVLPSPYWSVKETPDVTQIEASYKLKNYLKTWQFLNLVAANAHKLKHHPTITTTYNKIHIALTTHDVGNKVTYLDTKLATAIHNVYAQDFVPES